MDESDLAQYSLPEYPFPGPAPVMSPPDEKAVFKAEISLTCALNPNNTEPKRPKGIIEKDANTLLQWVVHYTRMKLADGFGVDKFRKAHSGLADSCATAQSISSYAIEKLGLTPLQMHTYSSFPKDRSSPENIEDRLSHSFVVVNIPILQPNNSVVAKPYLVDTTYRQFFDPADPKVRCHPREDLHKAGFVVTRTPEGVELADTLLKYGYCALNEKNAALYLGSFANGRTLEGSCLEKLCNAANGVGYQFSPSLMESKGIDASPPLRRLREERLNAGDGKRTLWT